MLQLSLDTTHNILHGRWNGQSDLADTQASYDALLQAAVLHQRNRFWLLDLQGRSWSGPPALVWFTSRFAALATQALGEPFFIAYVFDPAHYAEATAAPTETALRGTATHGCYPYFFDNEADARDWLLHHQRLDAGPGGQ